MHAREELGVDPDALPSPWTAASSSFMAFSLGAVVPLFPYLVGARSLLVALILSGRGAVRVRCVGGPVHPAPLVVQRICGSW